MIIRHSLESDLPRIMEIYARARAFMAETGNPTQWGPRKWPPEELIREDISEEKSYVCVDNGNVVGTFYYNCGTSIEPAYNVTVENGWSGGDRYGVVHRIATDGTKGVGTFCLTWALNKCGYLRIDTHEDNIVMKNLLTKLGFRRCGIISIPDDDSDRVVFDRKI